MKTLFVDQCAQLAGGELNLYDYLRSTPEGASVVLLEDGPFRPLLEQLGISVTILPLDAVGGVRRDSGVGPILRAVPAILNLYGQLAKAARGYDVLYANSQKAFFFSVLARRKGQPLVWHLHDLLVQEHFSSLLRKTAVFAGNHFATTIIVNSEATAKAYIAAGGRAEKLQVVYCGLDGSLVEGADPAAIERLRESICPRSRCLVGVFGRLAEWKGQHVLLEAVAALPDVHVAVVGDAFFGEDAYKERITERASQPDLAGRVHLLGFRKDIPELMLAMDVIAHTSTAPEPFGRVIVEGMLAGKPVIASEGGGASEIIVDGLSGLLTRPGDPAELSRAIERLKAQPSFAAELSQAGRTRARDLFSLQTMVSRVNRILAELKPRS